MEQSNGLKRSEIWNNIYEVLARLDLKEIKGDCLDRPSAATEIERLFLKLLPIQNVSKSLNADLQIDTKVKWKNVKGQIHKVLGGGFYEIRDDYDGHIWQGYKDSIKIID